MKLLGSFNQSSQCSQHVITCSRPPCPQCPLVPQIAHEPPDDPTEAVYSDVNKELLEKVKKKERKGPSQSVNVSARFSFIVFTLYSKAIANRQCSQSGSNMKANLQTSGHN